MNTQFEFKFINVVIVISLLSHLTILHNFLEDYVICYGTDGHIAVENVNDCDECPSIDLSTLDYFANEEVKKPECEDISIDQHCFEGNQFIINNNIDLPSTILVLNAVFSKSKDEIKFYYSPNTNNNKNQILDSYTTVSLLI
ncbi:MAG: hypothetical protein KJN64_06525 [Ignavibacteria bacterium]|nr:hypothetical protein [Ignavibacteria bacterium]